LIRVLSEIREVEIGFKRADLSLIRVLSVTNHLGFMIIIDFR